MRVTTASAGTGKTTALTKRVLELIVSGTPLRRIAAVTFMRAAASDLRSRIREGIDTALIERKYMGLAIPDDALPRLEEARREIGGAAIDTIHGYMARIVRLVAPALTRDPQLSVLEAWEADQLFDLELNTLITIASNDPDHELYGALQTLQAAGVNVREVGMDLFKARQLADELHSPGGPANDALKLVYDRAYHGSSPTSPEQGRMAGFLGRLGLTLTAPAEIERLAIAAVTGNEAMLERIRSRTEALLVDEYQDVNPTQATFFESLESAGVRVEVVGDPKQSIYLFRNADVEMFRAAKRTGTEGETLSVTYRHSKVITRFLNLLTDHLAQHDLGFGPDEAPQVTAAREETGRLEIHYVNGPGSLANLRVTEARVMARALKAARDRGREWREMAILCKGGVAVQILTAGLEAEGVPYVLTRGKNYYQRQEIVDLATALRVATKPRRQDWYTFLRSAFANLPVANIREIIHHDGDTFAYMRDHYPEVWQRVLELRRIAAGHPGDILADLAHRRLIDGMSFMETLALPARDNVTHLVRVLSRSEPASVSHLIDELDRLSAQTEASDMPQAADAVEVTTIHSSKGLEWPVVGVYDLGLHYRFQPDPIVVDPSTRTFALHGTDEYLAIAQSRTALERQELFRLLYVATSRARDEMILTGSYANEPGPLLAAVGSIERFALNAPEEDSPSFVLKHHRHDPDATPVLDRAAPVASVAPATGLRPAEWSVRTFPGHPIPPVNSPTRHLERRRLAAERAAAQEAEQAATEEAATTTTPVAVNVADIFTTTEPGSIALDEDEIPDRNRAVGTLVHYGINIGWDPDDEQDAHDLASQALLQQFPERDRAELIEDIKAMLRNYRSMIEQGLVAGEAEQEVREWPLQLRYANTVWTGIIDRLYKDGDTWVLEDYKTDGKVRPEQYHFQLGLYAYAVEQLLGVTPKVQLVYVRRTQVATLDPEDLRAALEEHTQATIAA